MLISLSFLFQFSYTFSFIIQHYQLLIQSMSSRKINQLFRLPFLRSYNSGNRRFISLAKVQTFLGLNFYSRLNNIYQNLVEAIARRNYRYLSSSFESDLSSKIFSELKSVEDGRYKIKIHSPSVKLTTASKSKKLRKMLAIRQNVWDNGTTKIGVQCNVIFGQKFDREDPLKKNQEVGASRVYRIGQFRYIRYWPQLGFFGNIKNWYKEQTYQIMVKYSSKMYLEVQNFDEVANSPSSASKNTEAALKNDEIFTEITMRTGNQKFDWIITDINRMNADKNKS